MLNAQLVQEAAARAGWSTYGEEGVRVLTGSIYTAVTDENDGTALYARGIPLSVFSLAVVDRHGVPLVGVVEEPLGLMPRQYYAVKDGASFMRAGNHVQQLHVSQQPLGPKAMVDSEWWPGAPEGYDHVPALHALSLATGTYVVTQGSVIAALMNVARGAFEACVFAGATPDKIVDSAAAGLIVRGAGGRVMDLYGKTDLVYDGRPIHGLLATNGNAQVRDKLLQACQPNVRT